MSANNFISIKKEDFEWCVEEQDADTGDMITDLGGWDDLESAVKCANAYMEENAVECGIKVTV